MICVSVQVLSASGPLGFTYTLETPTKPAAVDPETPEPYSHNPKTALHLKTLSSEEGRPHNALKADKTPGGPPP